MKSKSKYLNKKTEVDGIWFDSQSEAHYYLLLVDKKAKGEILDFERQPKFVLEEGFKKNNKKWSAITYKADFKVIHLDGSIEVIDIKGGKLTTDFKLKRKLFEKRYMDLTLRLLKKQRNGFVEHEQS